MAKYDFSVHYAGSGLLDNRIPIRDLAPSLLALSTTFQEIQYMINPDEPTMSLDIKASEKGSFIVDLMLTNGSDLFRAAIDFLNSNESNALSNLTTYVSVFTGIVDLIKQTKDKRIKKKEDTKDGTVKLTFEDNTNIVIPKDVLRGYQNVAIRKNIRESTKPLERNGVDSIDFYHSKEETVTITKSDYIAFEVPEIKAKELTTSESEVFLQIINVAFEHGKWKFSDGANQFFAKIEDTDFLKSVKHNQLQFGSTDTLKVLLRVKQYLDKDGVLKKENTVIKVLEHKKGTQQIELDLTDKLDNNHEPR